MEFLSTPSARRATTPAGAALPPPSYFYPRPPRGGRPPRAYESGSRGQISIHALREEGDLRDPSAFELPCQISIHALREEGDIEQYNAIVHRLDISIHALREEGDRNQGRCTRKSGDFYPRPPRGGRPPAPRHPTQRTGFLSTPSARRATSCVRQAHPAGGYFYPRPPRGGRLLRDAEQGRRAEFLSTPSARRATNNKGSPHREIQISIHALREEGDL